MNTDDQNGEPDTVHLARLKLMRDMREMSDEQLAIFQGSFTPNSEYSIFADQEWKRRHERPISWRSWVAIGIPAVALIVAVLVAIFK